MKSKIVNNANFQEFEHVGEFNSGQVISVPNEAYSIRELYERRVRNQPMPEIAKPASYGGTHESYDFEQVSKLDLVDQEDAARVIDEVIKRGNSRAEKARRKAEQVAAEKAAKEKAKDEFFAESMKKKNEAAGKKGVSDDN